MKLLGGSLRFVLYIVETEQKRTDDRPGRAIRHKPSSSEQKRRWLTRRGSSNNDYAIQICDPDKQKEWTMRVPCVLNGVAISGVIDHGRYDADEQSQLLSGERRGFECVAFGGAKRKEKRQPNDSLGPLSFCGQKQQKHTRPMTSTFSGPATGWSRSSSPLRCPGKPLDRIAWPCRSGSHDLGYSPYVRFRRSTREKARGC